ncbi:hypothetical protein [Roseivirga sp.]|uniref:hypothetical protein n=1 Tax=Roseivirga sp. TaxID=1964215 RepID=UPI003B51E860
MGILGEKLREYAEKLKKREDFFLSDVRRHEYFAENPQNDNEEIVRQKLSVLNHHEIHDLACHEEMVRHIVAMDIDPDLEQDNLELVPRLAAFHYKGKDYRLLSFSSEYCNSHKPNVFPIYNRKHIGLLKQYMEHHSLLKSDESLDDYFVFKRGLDHLLDRYRLNELLNYYEVKKLDWLYLDKLMAEVAHELNQ